MPLFFAATALHLKNCTRIFGTLTYQVLLEIRVEDFFFSRVSVGRRLSDHQGPTFILVFFACHVTTVTFFTGTDPLLLTDTLQDEKASVRRNAVPALEALLGFSSAFSGVAVEGVRGGATSEHAAELSLLQERCNDVSLSTRKVRLWDYTETSQLRHTTLGVNIETVLYSY